MVKRSALLDAFEKEQIRQNKADYRENLKIFEALYREAQKLGVFPLEDPLEGIEVKDRRGRWPAHINAAARDAMTAAEGRKTKSDKDKD